MKALIKSLFALALFAALASCNNQPPVKQQPDFNGLGIFKINQTVIKDLDSLKNVRQELTVKDDIQEIITLYGKGVVTNWPLLCKGVRIFSIYRYYLGDVEIDQIDLTFYRDTLISIKAHIPHDLLDAYKNKYQMIISGILTHLFRGILTHPVQGLFRSILTHSFRSKLTHLFQDWDLMQQMY